MPRQAQFSKESIIDVSIGIIRTQGAEALSARSICKEMGCSVSPLFRAYSNMEEIFTDVRKTAEKIFSDYVDDVCEYVPAFKEFGDRLVSFSREEPNIFRYLFLDRNSVSQVATDKAMECLSQTEESFRLTPEQAEYIYRQLWTFICGLAQLVNKDPDTYSEAHVSEMLSTQFTAMHMLIKSGRAIENIHPHLAMDGDKVLLRRWKDSDAEKLFEYASDPDLGPRAGWPPHRSVEESLEIIRNIFKNSGMWAIEKKDDGELIGCVGYLPYGKSNIPIGENDAEVGYWVAKPYWNQGICTDALKIVIDYCARVKSFKTLWGNCFTDNPASGRVMEKCGFQDTGKVTTCPSLEVGSDKETRVLKLDL